METETDFEGVFYFYLLIWFWGTTSNGFRGYSG